MGRGFGQIIGLHVILFFTLLVFLLLLFSPIMYMYTQAIAWNLSGSDRLISKLTFLIETFIKLLGFNMLLPLMSAGMGFLYFSLEEIVFAAQLKKSITNIYIKKSRAKVS